MIVEGDRLHQLAERIVPRGGQTLGHFAPGELPFRWRAVCGVVGVVYVHGRLFREMRDCEECDE